MPEMTHIAEDVGYVRSVVERCPEGRSPASIYFLWAMLVLAGFALVDFAPQVVGWYWLIAGLGGFVASALLGSRGASATGVRSARWGRRQMLHWGTLLAVIVLSVLPVALAVQSWDGFSANLLLLLGTVYVLAGVHLDRPLLPVGIALWVGYPLVLLLSGPAWTITGILVAAGLVAAGLWTRRYGERAG